MSLHVLSVSRWAGITLAASCCAMAWSSQIDPLSVLPHRKLSADFTSETKRTYLEFLPSIKDDAVKVISKTETTKSKGVILKQGLQLVIKERPDEEGSSPRVEAILDSRFVRINSAPDAKGVSGILSSFNAGGALPEIFGFRVDGESLGGSGITLTEILAKAKLVSKNGRTRVFELPARSSHPKQKPHSVEVELSQDFVKLVRVKTVSYDLEEPASVIETKFENFVEVDGLMTPSVAITTSSQRVMMGPGEPYREVEKWVRELTLTNFKPEADLTPYLPTKGAKFLESGYDTNVKNYFEWDGSRFVKASAPSAAATSAGGTNPLLFFAAGVPLVGVAWWFMKRKPGRLKTR